MSRAQRLGAEFGRDGGQGRRRRQIFITDNPRHLLDQVFFDLDVKPVGRWCHIQQTWLAHLNGQTQPAQGFHALSLADRHADDLGSPVDTERNRLGCRHVGLLIVYGASVSTADGLDQARDVFDVLYGATGVDPALEPMPGIG